METYKIDSDYQLLIPDLFDGFTKSIDELEVICVLSGFTFHKNSLSNDISIRSNDKIIVLIELELHKNYLYYVDITLNNERLRNKFNQRHIRCYWREDLIEVVDLLKVIL